ncbi:hypothetical protein V9K67_22935 [Paraflavisolibacter sp. H34]|uniref:hypothetical protein n=1 Tax=Huijunlia imazamoxiresistens TaxID=3127457 RepID=UPI0030184A5F
MKKVLMTLVLTLIVITASFRAQVGHLIKPAAGNSKEINISIKPAGDYQARVYAKARAQVNVELIKVNKKNTEVIWENQYPDVKLNQLETMGASLDQTVRVDSLRKRKEKLYARYTITYKSGKSVLKVEQSKALRTDSPSDELCINL